MRRSLETPTQQRTLTLPDASGTVITSGNREDITNLPGLQVPQKSSIDS